jgi:lipid A ethanolaminephosphotransferase
LRLALIASLWIALLGNWPLWRALSALPELHGVRGALFGLAMAGMIVAAMLALLSFFAWRVAIKPAIAFCLLSAAVGAHFMGSYGVIIDPSMMTNVLQTDLRETRDLLDARLALEVGVLALLPCLWLWRAPVLRRAVIEQGWRNAATFAGSIVVLVLLVLAVFADLSATMRNHKSVRYLINPLNSYFALGVLAYGASDRASGPPTPIATDAQLKARAGKPPLLMLVIGETARADHFSLNGYARDTDPELATRDVVSFVSASSCGTYTAESLPCMFSHLGRTAYQASEVDRENLLDALQRAGLAVLWIDNQSGCKGVCDRVPHATASEAAPGAAPLPAAICRAGECLDEALLLGLDQRLAALEPARRARGVVLVLHQMGSHGPAYAMRSPADRKPFLPECTTTALQQCRRSELINAYDNSIAYTDHVLAQGIDWLRRQTTAYEPALLYVSDHGESLGENNLYLHGLPYGIAPAEQKHVPLIVWLDRQTQASSGVSTACLRGRVAEPLSHDNLFHTVAGFMGVETSVYQPDLDLMAPCRAP